MGHIKLTPKSQSIRTSAFPILGAVLIHALLLGIGFWSGIEPSLAQNPLIIDPTLRSGKPPILEKEKPRPPSPPPRFILPPVDSLPELQPKRAPQVRVMVGTIHVEGSTVFTPEELDKVKAPYENRELSTEDLEELRRALTLLYTNNGYVNSGAIIPDQTVQEGEITFQIIEGKLTDINIEGTKNFLPFYFEQRIALSAGPPLNIRPLKERLQILLQDSRIQRLNSELKPGLKPGDGILHVKVEEASPFRAWGEFNNFQSPTIGAERGLGTIAVDNPFGTWRSFCLHLWRIQWVKSSLGYILHCPIHSTGYNAGIPISPE